MRSPNGALPGNRLQAWNGVFAKSKLAGALATRHPISKTPARKKLAKEGANEYRQTWHRDG